MAVGDVAFQSKCFNKLREIKGYGTTIVIVSHTLSQIEQICETSYWIDNGIIREFGTPLDVHPHYMKYMSEKTHEHPNQTVLGASVSEKAIKNKHDVPQDNIEESESKAQTLTEEKIVSINSIFLTNKKGEVKKKFLSDAAAILNIEYTCQTDKLNDEVMIGLLIFRNDNVIAYGTNTKNEGIRNINLSVKGTIQIEISKLNLGSGQYWIDVAVRKLDMFPYDYCSRGFEFEVMSPCNEVGLAQIEHKWKI